MKTEIMETPQIHFDGSTMTPVESINPYPRNNRKHGDDQIRLLAKNIQTLGWRWPIIVSKESGYIVAGHGRWMAAKFAGLSSVPVVVQSFKTPQDEEAFRIADNKIPELAEIQGDAIKAILNELEFSGYDMDLTGFDGAELAELLVDNKIPESNKQIDEGEMTNTCNECPKCGFKW